MKIAKIRIEKFRSIKHAEFLMNDITAVVGENNAGKTSILRAINAVLNFDYEKESFENKQHRFAKKTKTYVCITFSDVPDRPYYVDKTISGNLTIEFVYSYSNDKKQYHIVKGAERINIDESFLRDLSNDISYVYIPAGRTNKDVSWNNQSILHELVTSYASQYTENRDTISVQVKNATERIYKSVLNKLENRINTLYLQNKTVDFKFGFPDDLDYSILLNEIELSLNEYGSKYNLREWGSGTKSLAVIAMHRALALLKNRDIVLGIEEPETNLHPQAQKRFIFSLKNQLEENETQTIFTTHSTVLVNELSHADILLLRRVPDEKRGFVSVAAKLPSDFWQKYNITEFKHYQYFNYKNSDFFFSKFVILGESKIDCQVFEKLVRKELKERIADISFLDAGGVENIKYPYFLLKELQIPFITIVDRDFFFEYKNNNELDKSRNKTNGLPLYSDRLKRESVLDDLFSTDTIKQQLIDSHVQGYRKFFEFIMQYKILSMNYCLEMDLTCSSAARIEYYNKLNMLTAKRNQKELLINNGKGIKKAERILSIIDDIPHSKLPESYLKIKNSIMQAISEQVI